MKATILPKLFFAASLALMLSVLTPVPEAKAEVEAPPKCLDGNRQMCKNAELIYYWV